MVSCRFHLNLFRLAEPFLDLLQRNLAAVAKILRPLVRNMTFFSQNPNFVLHVVLLSGSPRQQLPEGVALSSLLYK